MLLCYTTTMKRTTIWLSEIDRDAIDTIKIHYGLATDSDAIRMAVRILAERKLEVSNESNQGSQDSA